MDIKVQLNNEGLSYEIDNPKHISTVWQEIIRYRQRDTPQFIISKIILQENSSCILRIFYSTKLNFQLGKGYCLEKTQFSCFLGTSSIWRYSTSARVHFNCRKCKISGYIDDIDISRIELSVKRFTWSWKEELIYVRQVGIQFDKMKEIILKSIGAVIAVFIGIPFLIEDHNSSRDKKSKK